MTPSAYYCWLSERRWLWSFRRRFQPRPDQNYPFVIALLMPFVVTGFALVPFAVLTAVVKGTANEADSPPTLLTFIYVIIGAVVFTSGVIHWGFTLLVWNQRAARLRASGSPATPPTRPGPITCWLLGPFYLLVIGLVTPMAILTAVENVRGAVRWRAVRTELLARGERLHIRQLVPQTPPAEQNFFSAPPFGHLLITAEASMTPVGASGEVPAMSHLLTPSTTSTRLVYNTNAAAEFRIFQLPEIKLSKGAGDGSPTTVAEWATAFRVALSNQSLPRWRDDRLPRYATPPAGADDAAILLDATSIAAASLSSLCDASQRPRAVFPVPWEDGFNAIVPHVGRLKSLNNFIDARVAAKLVQGDAAGAFADAECSLRLANMVREEPLLISQLVRFAQYAIAERTIWRGIGLHAWDDAQLAAFQVQLAKPDFVAGMIFGFEGERALGIDSWERWISNRRLLVRELDEVGFDGSNLAWMGLMPSGWLRQNQAELAAYYQRLLEASRGFATNPPSGGFLASALRRSDDPGQRPFAGVAPPSGPYGVLVRMLIASIGNSMTKAVQAQANALSAITGCALERYRLKHGAYPETLAALVPDFLPAVPLDPMNGQPLNYARSNDGLFRLWSVGENGKDDGGVSYAPEDKKKSRRNLDWVWPYPMP